MKTKILLVDDEKDIVEFLQYNLSNEGFKVITAYNGQEALDKLSQKPDLIILDVMMPKMDGY
ncbi:MAG: response regulator, partial [Ignavibacteria bacterium]|nr:response regulator [Ignavibacteria bacterium]